ncbi:uncharacterized protein MYCFIDRAFT_173001 [Pseudocercospora fijiensis CIRAD86]|uniref:Uncharacterized protein n=1 Tax=Pseudocercospora fijiensis (strain CIRAD86) TaxID=383855 RepID=M3AH79_PSEFD|nr:uncharacterized protein MYCFIDRAFT_173001 [Pseudocercospora fijiensis CIRAD86]EME83931.1 hypothetical protein MYCFIDRAFT_173001 [Pseudocercospora fijiensis CIRAD86]
MLEKLPRKKTGPHHHIALHIGIHLKRVYTRINGVVLERHALNTHTAPLRSQIRSRFVRWNAGRPADTILLSLYRLGTDVHLSSVTAEGHHSTAYNMACLWHWHNESDVCKRHTYQSWRSGTRLNLRRPDHEALQMRNARLPYVQASGLLSPGRNNLKLHSHSCSTNALGLPCTKTTLTSPAWRRSRLMLHHASHFHVRVITCSIGLQDVEAVSTQGYDQASRVNCTVLTMQEVAVEWNVDHNLKDLYVATNLSRPSFLSLVHTKPGSTNASLKISNCIHAIPSAVAKYW